MAKYSEIIRHKWAKNITCGKLCRFLMPIFLLNLLIILTMAKMANINNLY